MPPVQLRLRLDNGNALALSRCCCGARHVLYTCYQPAAQATEADLAAKRHAYENYAITTHWPAANVTVGAPPSDEERQKYTLPRTRSRVGPWGAVTCLGATS
jgi:hypothetical protein